jgi:hypothetical protein
MSEAEVQRVLGLVERTSSDAGDLSPMLAEKDADQLVDEVFSNEIHTRHP